MTDIALLQDLAVMTVLAGVGSVIFSRFGWPKVLGYMFAGILMSPYTWGGPYLLDAGSVQTLGQLGIIFLMFSLGLEFSASSIKKIGNVTITTAAIDTIIMTWLGYTVGTRFLGWDMVPSLFLGAAICDSSTTLLAKIIDEMKWSNRLFAKYVVGTSVCEDIICVGIIALITGVAKGAGMSVTAVGMSLGGLIMFFMATLVVGLIIVPRLLAIVAKRKDDEALLLTLLGCCFFVTYIAFKLDYSIALGAFIMGVIGAGSDVRDRLYELSAPLKSLFAAIFFVSIGLLVNPMACLENWLPIVVISLVVMIGKGVNCFLGGILTGESIKTATQMSFGLAQIGEFAFMVALLYVSLTNDVDSPMYQIVVGVSLLTTILNPVMIRISDPIGNWLERNCPKTLKRCLDSYRTHVRVYRQRTAPTEYRKMVTHYVRFLVVLAVIEFAVVTAIGLLRHVDYSNFSVFFEQHDKFFFCLIANIFMLGIAVLSYRVVRRLSVAASNVIVGVGHTRWQTSTRQFIHLAILLLVGAAFYAEWSMLNVNLLPDETWARWTLVCILLAMLVFGWKLFVIAGHNAVFRLRHALSAEERRANKPAELVIEIPGGKMQKLEVAAGSVAVGETVGTLNIRAKTGAVVVSVERNGKIVRNIGPKFKFAARDTVVAIGEDAQLSALGELLGEVSQ